MELMNLDKLAGRIPQNKRLAVAITSGGLGLMMFSCLLFFLFIFFSTPSGTVVIPLLGISVLFCGCGVLLIIGTRLAELHIRLKNLQDSRH